MSKTATICITVVIALWMISTLAIGYYYFESNRTDGPSVSRDRIERSQTPEEALLDETSSFEGFTDAQIEMLSEASCDGLKTLTFDQLVDSIDSADDVTYDDAVVFASYAVDNHCPEYTGEMLDWYGSF